MGYMDLFQILKDNDIDTYSSIGMQDFQKKLQTNQNISPKDTKDMQNSQPMQDTQPTVQLLGDGLKRQENNVQQLLGNTSNSAESMMQNSSQGLQQAIAASQGLQQQRQSQMNSTQAQAQQAAQQAEQQKAQGTQMLMQIAKMFLMG